MAFFAVAARRALTPSVSMPALRRCYAAAAVPLDEPFPGVPTPTGEGSAAGGVQTGTLDNGVTVVVNNTGTATAKVVVAVAAGPRFETKALSGVSSILNFLAFQSTPTRSAVRMMREADYIGATNTSWCGRESVFYQSAFTADKSTIAVDALFDAVAAQNVLPWEVEAAQKRLQLSSSCEVDLVMDDLYACAFRTGLGNPVHSPFTSSVDTEGVKAHIASTFQGKGVTVTATGGVSLEEIMELAKVNFAGLPAGAAPSTAEAKYHGGAESRTTTSKGSATFGIAFEGVSSKHADAPALSVLCNVLGGTSQVKYCNSSTKLGGNLQCKVFSETHAVGGLFGAVVTTDADNAAASAQQVAKGFKEVLAGNVSEDAFKRAHAATKLQFSQAGESTAAVDGVTLQSVKQAAMRLKACKPVMAVRGNTFDTPHLDELF